MANKFTKSILERQQHQPAAEPTPPVEATGAAARPDSPELYTIPAADPAPQPQQPAPAPAPKASAYQMPEGLAELLTPAPQRSAKNKTFYLDAQVIDAIKTVAKKQKITESRLVNDLLRRVLGL